MRSLLTRRVFRCLTDGIPLPHHDRPKRLAQHGVPALRPEYLPRNVSWNGAQRRAFLDFSKFRNRGRKGVTVHMAPGLYEMSDLVKRQRVQARLPDRAAIIAALFKFFSDSIRYDRPIEDTQAHLVFRSLQYCTDGITSRFATQSSELAKDLLAAAIKALSLSRESSEFHVQLCELVLAHCTEQSKELCIDAIRVLCQALVQQKRWTKAYDLLKEFEEGLQVDADIGMRDPLKARELLTFAWVNTLAGAVASGGAAQINRVYSTLPVHYMQSQPAILLMMLRSAQEQKDLNAVRKWWGLLLGSDRSIAAIVPTAYPSMTDFDFTAPLQVYGTIVDILPAATKDLLRWCADGQHLELGNEVVSDVLEGRPPLSIWNAVLLWAAASGKGADEIDRMIGIMETNGEQDVEGSIVSHADATTINGLVALAMTMKDPYLAERFTEIGRRRNISPNSQTHALQIQYRLDVNDTEAALVAYEKLKHTSDSIANDLKCANRLITVLCRCRVPNFDTIMMIVADMTDSNVAFDADSVSALVTLHLYRNEMDDVEDLLNTHVANFSAAHRAQVAASLIEFCSDDSVTTSHAWVAYNILREIFDEITRPLRTDIMATFFKRGRSDIAVYIFNHMRFHSRVDTAACAETYITAFEEIGRLGDMESLEIIHNQLKLDYNTESTTALRNALMSAYTSCDSPRNALQIWDEIVASKEGPDHDSIHGAFRACGRSPYGLQEAFEILDMLWDKHIEIDGPIWRSFAVAAISHGGVSRVTSTLEEAERRGEIKIDRALLSELYTAGPDATHRSEIAEWAAYNYPQEWKRPAEVLDGVSVEAV